MLSDIADVTEASGAPTWLWGGMAVDAHLGRFSREHGDIDGMTLDLWRRRERLSECYRERGYPTYAGPLNGADLMTAHNRKEHAT